MNWLFFVTLVNFFAFVFVAVRLGGDAVNGKIENGHFYLASHGRYTEVSEAVFTYSKWHTYSVILTYSVLFIAALFLHRRGKVRPKS